MAGGWTLGSGLLLGFASSLHCIGMCGGIALLLGRGGGGSGPSVHPLISALPLHGGRISAYLLMGGLAGGIGTLALAGLDGAVAHGLLRWASAMTLAWIGFAMLGLMPTPAVVGRFILANVPSMTSARAITAPPAMRGYVSGLGWGLMPCGMVYGALLYAAFSGSVIAGLLAMAGFGLGTLPALLLVQCGSAGLTAMARKPALRAGAALLILLVAALSLVAGEASLLALCGLQ